MALDEEEDDILKRSKLTRRTFIKGAAAGGAIAAVAVAGAAELTVLSNPNQNTTTGTQTSNTSNTSNTNTTSTTGPAPLTPVSTVTLNINGISHTLDVDNRWPLAFTLRERFNMIGTKIGCDRGECGACAVLVDGVPMLGCMLLTVDAQGHALTTIEGLGGPGNLSKIETALVDNDGVQCGFCIPGIVVVATAFQKANPTATDAQWRAALAGNLCKCSNHPFILQALESVK
jgi:aerobic-type carbon monoxide dehydrogenase small subunit (CoxS/CutS family)